VERLSCHNDALARDACDLLTEAGHEPAAAPQFRAAMLGTTAWRAGRDRTHTVRAQRLRMNMELRSGDRVEARVWVRVSAQVLRRDDDYSARPVRQTAER